MTGNVDKEFLLYDGECPFCNSYVKLMKLKNSFPSLEIINARDAHDLVYEYRKKGLEINNGMILKIGGVEYFGSDCIHVMALMNNNLSLATKLNKHIFASKTISKLIYPILVILRKIYFKLIFKKMI